MWVDGIILDADIELDGGASPVDQKLIVTTNDNREILINCPHLCTIKFSANEWDNLNECISALLQIDEDGD